MPLNKFAAVGIVATLVILTIVGLGFAGYIPALNSLFYNSSLKTSRVMTYSMEPTIKMGALVSYDASIPFGNLAVGDIILFNVANSSNIWVSRIIHIYPGEASTKGDGNPAPEGFNITSSMYIGKVMKIQNP
jgi:signal peptidase I